MKKKILTLILPAVAMITAACGETKPCNHKDDNKDHLCDLCGEKISDHIDENPKDHKCDICEQSMGEHADKNNDHNCDYCGAKMSEHTAPNAEGKCDICGEVLVPPTPENKELEKFNELVASIKKNHNYTLTINSVVEGLEDEDLNCHRYNLNDKAWFHDNSIYDAEGIIYQKDQGYVTFVKNGNKIIPMSLAKDFDYETNPRIFVSTNPSLKISDITEVIGENLFIGEYVQDSKDKSKFTTTNVDNRAVAAYLTQYYDYISTGQLQIANSMDAVVDVENSTITLSLEYSLWYFDEVEVKAPGVITITLENVASTSNEVIEEYMANPSYVFTAPTSWPEGMDKVFATYYNSEIPNIPERLSYGAVCGPILYDGFYYAAVQDVNSGDLSSSYGQQLLKEGYSKVGDSYVKKSMDDVTTITHDYKVKFLYEESNNLYPNGVFTILYKCNSTTGSFNSIEEFNDYLERTGRDEIVPVLPTESTCTGITNFKDVTSEHEGYSFYSGTDWMHVNIPTYEKAVAWKNNYINALAEMGYDDYSSFLWDSYNYCDSTTGTFVAMSIINESSYKGYVDIRYQVSEVDDPFIRTRNANIVSIAVSDYLSSFETGSAFSFGGKCIATFDNGATRTLNSSEFVCFGYNMNEEGKQTVTVEYAGDSSIKTSYEIEVKTTREVTKIELGGSPTLQFVKNGTFNHTGLSVKATYDNGDVDYVGNDASCTYDVDLSSTGIKDVTVSYKYHDKTVTAKYQILVNETLTWPSISFESTENLQWADIYDSYGDQEISEFNYNQESSFYVDVYPVEGFSIDSISIKNDPDARIIYDDEMYMYQVIPTINLEMSEIVVCVELSGEEVVKYNVTSAALEHGSITLSSAKYKPGDTVQFTVNPDSGYSIESVSSDPTIVISEVSAGKYQFVMPAEDVELSASFSLIPVAHSIATNVTGSGSINSITVNGVAGTNAMAGDTVLIDAKPSEESIYRVKSAVITTDGGTNVEWVKKGGKFQFTMPEDNVTFTVVFEEIPSYSISKDTNKTNISYNSGVTSNTAKVGFTVVFKPIAVEGYVVDKNSISVTMTEGGESVSCVPGFATGTYQFTMPEGPVTISVSSVPIQLQSISVTGAKSSFNVDDDFSTDGLVVTATMNDGSSKIVTPTSIDSSKVDMSKEGTYEVIVSYTEDGITKSTNYNVNVSDGEQPAKPVLNGTYAFGNRSTFVFNNDGTGYETYTFGSTYTIHFTYEITDHVIVITVDSKEGDSAASKFGTYRIAYETTTSVSGTVSDDNETVKLNLFNSTGGLAEYDYTLQ